MQSNEQKLRERLNSISKSPKSLAVNTHFGPRTEEASTITQRINMNYHDSESPLMRKSGKKAKLSVNYETNSNFVCFAHHLHYLAMNKSMTEFDHKINSIVKRQHESVKRYERQQERIEQHRTKVLCEEINCNCSPFNDHLYIIIDQLDKYSIQMNEVSLSNLLDTLDLADEGCANCFHELKEHGLFDKIVSSKQIYFIKLLINKIDHQILDCNFINI